jgi:hypothetical protein
MWFSYEFYAHMYFCIFLLCMYVGSRDSVVGIATRYGLEGPGIKSRWGEIFHTYPDRLQGPPSLLYNGYWVFPGVKGGRVVMLTTHPLLVLRLRKSWGIPPLIQWVLLGLLWGTLYPLCMYVCIFIQYNLVLCDTVGVFWHGMLFVFAVCSFQLCYTFV